jgi:CRISPR system Cascade subunit CasA
MPLPGTDPEAAAATACLARRLVAAAEIVAQALRRAVRDALFSRDTKVDSAPLATVYEAFWAATQDRFFRLLRAVQSDCETSLKSSASEWHGALCRAALRLFDEAAPLDPTAVSFKPERIVAARRNLFFALEGYGANGNRLFEELLLPSPQPKTRRTAQGRGGG